MEPFEPRSFDVGLKERTHVYINVEEKQGVPLPPIAVNLSSEHGPFNFLEFVTPNQAVEWSKALVDAAMLAEELERTP